LLAQSIAYQIGYFGRLIALGLSPFPLEVVPYGNFPWPVGWRAGFEDNVKSDLKDSATLKIFECEGMVMFIQYSSRSILMSPDQGAGDR